MTGRSSWKNSFLPCILVSSWNSHWWVTAQWGAAQEAIPHYSKCLWLNNNCSSNGVLLIYKCILWKPRFSVTVKKNKKGKNTQPSLTNSHWLTLSVHSLGQSNVGFALVLVLLPWKNHLHPGFSQKAQSWSLSTQHQPLNVVYPGLWQFLVWRKRHHSVHHPF